MASLVVPVCILLIYEAVLDERVHKVTGVDSVYGLSRCARCCPRSSAP